MTYADAQYSLVRFAFTRQRFLFVFIHLFCIAGLVVLPIMGEGHWIASAICVAVMLVYWIGNYGHRERLRKLNATPSGSPHREDVCEGCDPVCWKDGRPLTEFYQWYAAIMDETWDRAKLMIAATPEEELEDLRSRHATYLLHPKFDKFK